MLFFWTFYSLKESWKKTYPDFHKNIKQHSCFKLYFLTENSNFFISGINYILNYIK